jgi:hypothetical protein
MAVLVLEAETKFIFPVPHFLPALTIPSSVQTVLAQIRFDGKLRILLCQKSAKSALVIVIIINNKAIALRTSRVFDDNMTLVCFDLLYQKATLYCGRTLQRFMLTRFVLIL